MDDLKYAQKELIENDYTLCIVKENSIVYSSKKRGVLPLYQLYVSGTDLMGCSCSDKVIGLGAAVFYEKLRPLIVSTKVISKKAYDYLIKYNIPIDYEIMTEKILNRNKDGSCPIEKIAESSESFDEFIKSVKEFFEK